MAIVQAQPTTCVQIKGSLGTGSTASHCKGGSPSKDRQRRAIEQDPVSTAKRRARARNRLSKSGRGCSDHCCELSEKLFMPSLPMIRSHWQRLLVSLPLLAVVPLVSSHNSSHLPQPMIRAFQKHFYFLQHLSFASSDLRELGLATSACGTTVLKATWSLLVWDQVRLSLPVHLPVCRKPCKYPKPCAQEMDIDGVG